jgi:hypothetical protein
MLLGYIRFRRRRRCDSGRRETGSDRGSEGRVRGLRYPACFLLRRRGLGRISLRPSPRRGWRRGCWIPRNGMPFSLSARGALSRLRAPRFMPRSSMKGETMARSVPSAGFWGQGRDARASRPGRSSGLHEAGTARHRPQPALSWDTRSCSGRQSGRTSISTSSLMFSAVTWWGGWWRAARARNWLKG